ncbi:ABC transporter ATP-binding protein [Micromonospora sp. NPDC049559]|uniref:ABC transporter ATP-binding protein n=1 Tax=Micromonospora sp. NPDC049559 TaxID=3155923 RepID=UPI00344295B1
MVTIGTDRLTKTYGDVVAVDGVSLDVAEGEVVALLGPTGCGKSTILRLVAGLEQPTAGHVLLDGRIADELSTRERRVAMVFQDYALYPHLTVAQNIGFPLRSDPEPGVDIPARVAEVARHLGIVELLDRRPRQLSGGERQRVAVARAIVRQPAAFLLDEPLSNLDAGLRAQLRTEVAALARRLGVTTLHVTHDQVEAMTMADRVAVLRRGSLQQIGTPARLYADPRTLFVAAFLGSPRPSLAQAAVYAEPDRVVVDLGSQTIELPRDDPRWAPLADRHTERVTVVLRPEALTPVAPGAVRGPELRGTVRSVENLGHESLVRVDIGALPAAPAQSRLELPEPGRHLTEPPGDRAPGARPAAWSAGTATAGTGGAGPMRPLRQALARMIPSRRPAEVPATARTEYGFYPVYDPELPAEAAGADLVVRLAGPARVRRGESMVLAVDLARMLLFDRAGERITLP